MNPHTISLTLLFTSLATLTTNLSANDSKNIQNELIGAWQIGLDKYAGEMDEKQAFREGLLASIFYFGDDKSFKIYVPCGANEIPSLADAPSTLYGKWELRENTMTITVNAQNKTEILTFTPRIKNKTLILSGEKELTLGRYEKETPPKCK